MTKTIILSDKGPVEMSFEDILKQFEFMIEGFANEALNKMVYNKPEREDILQELKLQAWEAYRRYNGQNAFSTYLTYRLQHGIHRATTKLYAKKRINTAGVISLNDILGGDDGELELQGILGKEDLEICSYEFREFVQTLEKILDDSEKKVLKVLMDKDDYSVQDLADQLHISRQGANKKVVKLREKMEILMKDTGFVPTDIRKLRAV